MKKYYESPEVKATLFVSQQALAFSFDELENVLQNPEKAGTPTTISKEDVMVPLG